MLVAKVDPLLITETAPETAPTTLGENTILIVDWLPAAMVIGKAAPIIVNPLAAVLACVTVRSDPPPFDKVTDCETVPPIATDPNVMEAGNAEIAAESRRTR